MNRLFFCLLFSALLLGGCRTDEGNAVGNLLADCDVVASKEVVGNDTIIVWHTQKMDPERKIRIPLSELVDSLEIIHLDGKDENAFCGMGPIWISDNYIMTSEGMRNAPSLLFGRDGSFKTKLGNKGTGPGEYRWRVGSRQIDEENGLVYIHPQLNTDILIYDFDGNYFGNIPLSYTKETSQMEFFVNKREGTMDVIRLCCNYHNQMSPDTSVTVWRQSLDGKVLDSLIYSPFMTTYRDILVMYTVAKDDSGITFLAHHNKPEIEERTDTMYRYDFKKQELSRLMTMEISKPTLNHYFFPFSSYYFCRYWDDSEYTPENPCVSHYGMLDPTTMRGAECEVYNDLLGGIDLRVFDWQGSVGDEMLDNNYGFAWMYDPGDLLDKVETRLQETDISENDRKILEELRERIDPDGNNIILLGRQKK